jgi:hypothetical protein
MSWLDAPGFDRRPLVFVEDHLYHTGELLQAVAALRPDLLPQLTAVCIERAGPDTDAAIGEWLVTYPQVRFATFGSAASGSHAALTPATIESVASFASFIALLIRPGGLYVQDVQLSTLPFVPADRWWQSIFVAATVRGLFADRQPSVRFISNKRGYTATFGRDLVDAGFDPRDVMDKSELARAVVPTVAGLFDRRFTLRVRGCLGAGVVRSWPVAADDLDRRDLEDLFDVLVWPAGAGLEISGRLVRDTRVALKPASHEAATWRALVDDACADRQGLAVVKVGERIGPAGADRAELTNLAARHIHTLRSRLTDASAIVTASHTYRFADQLRVAACAPAPPATSADPGR